MSDVHLKYIDRVHVKVCAEPSTIMEMSDRFTFYAEGYKFSPKYKARVWDGKIRLLDLRNNTMYYGLIPYLQKFCDEREYKVYYEPDVQLTEDFSIKEAVDFINTLGLPFNPRNYQVDSFVHAIRNRRTLLLSPTASGKSLILYLVLRYIQTQCDKGLLIVPTTSLVEQMYSDFETYGYDSEQYCHKQYAGKDKFTDKIGRAHV